MKRGIIANSGRSEIHNSGGVAFSNSLSQDDVNYFVLYWDKIVMPTTDMFHYAIPNEEELIKIGLLERPVVSISFFSSHSESYHNPFIIAQSTIADKLLSQKGDIDWTIHQIGEEVIIAKEFQKEYQTVKLKLSNCLPVPYGALDPNKLLEFKTKRNDELKELHKSIDQLYFEVLKSPDKDLQVKISTSEFIKAISNVEKSSTEFFKKTKKYDFTTEININGKSILEGITAGLAFNFFANPVSELIVPIIGGIGSMIKIKGSRVIGHESSKNKLNLSYLSKASEAGIIK